MREQFGSRGFCYHYGGGVDNPPFRRNRIKLLLTSIDGSDLSELEANGGLRHTTLQMGTKPFSSAAITFIKAASSNSPMTRGRICFS